MSALRILRELASNLGASFFFFLLSISATTTCTAERGGEQMLQINQESSAALQWKRSCWFKSANRRRAWPRFSFQYPVWVGGFSYDPPLLNLRFGCTQYAISLCFIQRFEYLKVIFFLHIYVGRDSGTILLISSTYSDVGLVCFFFFFSRLPCYFSRADSSVEFFFVSPAFFFSLWKSSFKPFTVFLHNVKTSKVGLSPKRR